MVDADALRKDIMELNNSSLSTLAISTWKGYRLPIHLVEENLRYAMEEWEWPEKSIFVVTFPKCGTTWMTEIVRNILYGRDKSLRAVDEALRFPFHMVGLGNAEIKFKLYDTIPLPRKYFGLHIREELFNFEKLRKVNGKVIYMLRNPKDQLVSWFNFSKIMIADEKLRKELYSTSWDEFFEEYLEGKHGLYTKVGEGWPFAAHIKPWLKRSNDPDVLIVSYERLRKDTKGQIRRIADFLEITLSEEDVTNVYKNTSLRHMQEEIEKMGGYNQLTQKGEVGQWKNRFTVAQSERMDRLIEDAFGDIDYKFTFE